MTFVIWILIWWVCASISVGLRQIIRDIESIDDENISEEAEDALVNVWVFLAPIFILVSLSQLFLYGCFFAIGGKKEIVKKKKQETKVSKIQ